MRSWPTTSRFCREAFLTTLVSRAAQRRAGAGPGHPPRRHARVSPVPPLRGSATFYVELVRNTPLTVVFFFLVFGLPEIDLQFPRLHHRRRGLALALYTAAFVCEAVRSGINSVAAGQAEAARASA